MKSKVCVYFLESVQDALIPMTILVALYDYVGITDKELHFKQNTKFELLDNQHEDWWLVKDEHGVQGFVPGSYMEVVKDSGKSITLLNDNPPPPSPAFSPAIARLDELQTPLKEAMDTNDLKSLKSSARSASSKTENESEEESDDRSSQDESEDDEDDDSEVDVDETSGDIHIDLEQVKQVLNGLNKRKSILKLRKTMLVISDKAPDNLPAGFRFSSLGKSFDSGQGHASQFLTPELDNSSLGFKDVHLSKRNMIRKRLVKCNLSFTINQLRNAPNPNPLQVAARFIRIALFDKTNIVSNIHTVPAFVSATDSSVWKFQVGSGLFSNGGDEACFVRTIDVDIKLCILFEMVLVVKKTEQLTTPSAETPLTPSNPNEPTSTGFDYQDRIEISCGWSLLPLFTSDGLDLESKTYNLQVFGGNPFERDVLLAPTLPKSSSFLSTLLNSHERGPRLVIKVNKLRRNFKNQLNDLPDVLIGNITSIPVLSIYRRVLANVLLGAGQDKSFGSRYEPILALVPQILEQADFMKFLSYSWTKRLKNMRASDKKLYQYLKGQFTNTVMMMYPLLYIDLPPYIPGHYDSSVVRSEMCQKLHKEGVIGFLSKVGAAATSKRFDVKELEFNYLKDYVKLVPTLQISQAQ